MVRIKIAGDYIKESGRTVGRVSGMNIVDSGGKTLAKIDKDYIKDSSSRTIGRISGSYLKDGSGKNLVSMSDIRKSIDGAIGGTRLAAIWLLFIK